MVEEPERQRITVAQAVERHLDASHRAVVEGSLSRHTVEGYRRDLHEFVELVGQDTVLDDVTNDDIDDAVRAFGSRPDARFKNPSAGKPKLRGVGAQARFRQSVSRLFTEAALAGWVIDNPMPRTTVKPRTRTRTRPRTAASEPVAVSLLEASAERRTTRADQALVLRDEFLLRLLTEAGPRVSEVCSANRSDLAQDGDGTWWLTVTGKGGTPRRLPLSQGTVDAYFDYAEKERPQPRPRTRFDPDQGRRVVTAGVEDAEAALVLTWRGVRMTPRDIQLLVKRTTATAGLPAAVTPHSLRRAAAGNLDG